MAAPVMTPEAMLAFLRKALAAERTAGYRDRAVIGGFARLAESVHAWRQQHPEAVTEAFVTLLRRYPGTAKGDRPEALAGLERALEGEEIGDTHRDPISSRDRVPVCVPDLASPVTVLKGVKEQKAKLLARIGVRTLGDLVWLQPERHEDRSVVTPIGSLEAGAKANLRARVASAEAKSSGIRKMRLEAVLEDGTGQIRAVWFNQPWMAKLIVPGARGLFHGSVRLHDEQLELQGPEFEYERAAASPVGRAAVPVPAKESERSRLVPIYPLTAGLFQKSLRYIIESALDLVAGEIAETLPPSLVEKLGLMAPLEALRQLHRPASTELLAAARRRLCFEELFYLELAVAVKRHLFTTARPGVVVEDRSGLVERLFGKLPFRLTGAQERAVADILADLRTPRAMARLVQGDVGAGKTVVALAALMATAGAGLQGALMAPTEILAGQHYLAIRRLCADLGVGVELVTGSQTSKQRRESVEAIRTGASSIAVGTHALLEGEVELPSLGLAVIDEQHRFGVNQRARLKLKGDNPNLLVMTATPIPRTLALTLYGDLDVSLVNEMPPGRQPIRTKSLPLEKVAGAYARIRSEVEKGRQAYIVCPLVEESEKLEAEAAQQTWEEVRENWLAGLRVELLHGRMPGAKKSEVMEAMRAHEADVLVSTTVIEVGVDVPNATVMVVLNAERFGLAQLHQLRGRIGRGSHPSVFLPIVAARTRPVRERMQVLEGSADGFVVAEKDLELRGPGEFFGTRQSGLDNLRVASLPRDLPLLDVARREAFALVEQDPWLKAPELQATRAFLMARYGAFVNRRH